MLHACMPRSPWQLHGKVKNALAMRSIAGCDTACDVFDPVAREKWRTGVTSSHSSAAVVR